MQRLRLLAPPPRFVAFALAVPPDASLVRSPTGMDATLVGPGLFILRCPLPHSSDGEYETSQGSWGTLVYMPRSSTPADRSLLATTERAMLPSAQKTTSAPRSLFPFEALSRGLHPPCVRFVAGLATRQRNTRFRAVASLSPGQDSHLLGSYRKFLTCVVLHGFPSLQALPGAIPAETPIPPSRAD